MKGLSVVFDKSKSARKTQSIKVIGVGGGGTNAVNYMHKQKIDSVGFIVCNTDNQALEASSVSVKLRLGEEVTQGMGAGADPEAGRSAAEESIERIQQVIDKDTKVLFITAGMGGGTGTGASPVIAEIAKKQGILTIAIVTKPRKYEGPTRQKNADEGLKALRPLVDSLVVIDNQKLYAQYPDLGIKSGNEKADKVLYQAVHIITNVMNKHYEENPDLSDIRRIFKNNSTISIDTCDHSSISTAMFGVAQASGRDRVKDVVFKATHNLLLDRQSVENAKDMVLVIESAKEEQLKMKEHEAIMLALQELTGGTDIISGFDVDDKLEKGVIRLTIIAAGFSPVQKQKENHNITSWESDKPLVYTYPKNRKKTKKIPRNQLSFNYPESEERPIDSANHRPEPAYKRKGLDLTIRED